MKFLTLSICLLSSLSALAADELSVAMEQKLPEVKKNSEVSYRKLHAGFEFKGFGESPGHQAILKEMQTYYSHLKQLKSDLKKLETFPEKSFTSMQTSHQRVEKLAGYVVMDKDVQVVLDGWLKSAKDLSQSKEKMVTEIKVKKVDRETKKIEKAIEKEKKKQEVDPVLSAKEDRLQALQDHYRLLQKQNRAIIQAGYTTPSGYFPSSQGGYYYNNGTFYPRSYYNHGHNHHGYNNSHCSPYNKRPRVRIIYKK